MEAPTIDPREVDYYDRLAQQWWDKSGKFWPLHRLNELRVEYLKHAVCLHFGLFPGNPAPLKGLSVLDIGCGGGILSESMAALGASVKGIDVVEKSLNVARQHSQHSGLAIDYDYVSVESLAEREEQYDVVLNMEVVEHVADLPAFMSCCNQLLAKDGIMFIATINRNPLSWLFAIVGAEYILGWLPRGTHRWSKFVRPGELTELLARDALTVNAATGVSVNPFTRHFSLCKRTTVNYMLSAIHATDDRIRTLAKG